MYHIISGDEDHRLRLPVMILDLPVLHINNPLASSRLINLYLATVKPSVTVVPALNAILETNLVANLAP